MKYVALLSGGKDSCYNLLHCEQNGHELVAAASLGPGRGKEEIDSHFYQTVGQDAIEFVARALDVPLYRRIISGAAIHIGSEYGSRDARDSGNMQGDETEDLFDLLSDVKRQHPDIQGVSAGAILSDYQRVRLEHVCRRLSLTPLCYLWQRHQAELLLEMIEAGLDAIIIKVAGAGLTKQHLGRSLAEMRQTLLRLNDQYGSHVCGEGGEYETLTLDCPLFKQRIILTETETVIHSDNDFATVAYLRIKDATLELKEGGSNNLAAEPPLLEESFAEVDDFVLQSLSTESTIHPPSQEPTHDEDTIFSVSSRKSGPWLAVASIHRNTDNGKELTVEEEVRECFSILEERLLEHSFRLSHCANMNVFLSSMDHFPRLNAVYSTYFGTSPPARACVAVDLPSRIRVMIDCVAYNKESIADRSALHVQSLSYWAPANIGPYSQAITADGRIFISGQIGLIPSSLSLPALRSLPLETALAFQHVERIKEALKGSSSGAGAGHTQLALYWLADKWDIPHVKRALGVYHKEVDVPTLLVAVKSLPKDALVEKQVLCHTGRFLEPDEDDEIELKWRAPLMQQGDLSSGGVIIHWETSSFDMVDGAPSYAIVCVRGEGLGKDVLKKLQSQTALFKISARALSIRLFYTQLPVSAVSTLIDALCNTSTPVTPIPCRSISSRAADGWDFAICIINDWDNVSK